MADVSLDTHHVSIQRDSGTTFSRNLANVNIPERLCTVICSTLAVRIHLLCEINIRIVTFLHNRDDLKLCSAWETARGAFIVTWGCVNSLCCHDSSLSRIPRRIENTLWGKLEPAQGSLSCLMSAIR